MARCRHFTRARRVRPSDHHLPGLISHVYMRQGQWSRALAYVQEAERLNPRRCWSGGQPGSLLRRAASVRRCELLLGPGAGRDASSGQRPSGQGSCVPQSHRRPEGSPGFSPRRLGKHLAHGHRGCHRLASGHCPAAERWPADSAAPAHARRIGRRHRGPGAGQGAGSPAAQPTSSGARVFDSARVVLQDKVRRHPDEDPFYHAMLGLALAGLERPVDAVREGERAVALLPYPAGGSREHFDARQSGENPRAPGASR